MNATGTAMPIVEMVGKARLPGDVDVIADLQDRACPARAPAVHEPEMAAVHARQDLDHGRGLAVGANRENDAFVGPIHEGNLDEAERAVRARMTMNIAATTADTAIRL